MKNSISIIMPVTRPKNISNIVESILRQKNNHQNLEIILVGKTLPKLNYNVKIITKKIKKTLNPAQSRNYGAKFARGPILIFLDDDCVPQKGWFENCVKLVKPKKIGAVSGSILGISGKYFAQCVDFCNFTYVQSDHKRTMPISSASFVISKRIYQKLGGFDENLLIGEDTDLCMRIQQIGYQTLYDPRIKVWHHHSRDTLKRLLAYQFRNGKIKGLYIENKYPISLWFKFLKIISHPLLYGFFILPFAVLSSLNAVIINIREHPKVIILLPGIFLGKLSVQLGTFYWILQRSNQKPP